MERQRGGRANSKTGLLTEHTAIAPEDRKIIILVQALKKKKSSKSVYPVDSSQAPNIKKYSRIENVLLFEVG